MYRLDGRVFEYGGMTLRVAGVTQQLRTEYGAGGGRRLRAWVHDADVRDFKYATKFDAYAVDLSEGWVRRRVEEYEANVGADGRDDLSPGDCEGGTKLQESFWQ